MAGDNGWSVARKSLQESTVVINGTELSLQRRPTERLWRISLSSCDSGAPWIILMEAKCLPRWTAGRSSLRM